MESINAGLFPRRQKEPFDQMSTRSPIPINANATRASVLRTRPLAQSQNSSWRLVSRPCALGIVGLAVAVFLWGYGYKLSLYHCHSGSSSHTPVAKLWIEPRSAPIAAASSLKAKSHFVACNCRDRSAASQHVPRRRLHSPLVRAPRCIVRFADPFPRSTSNSFSPRIVGATVPRSSCAIAACPETKRISKRFLSGGTLYGFPMVPACHGAGGSDICRIANQAFSNAQTA